MFRSLRFTALVALGTLTLAGCSNMSGNSATTSRNMSDEQNLVDNATHTIGVMNSSAIEPRAKYMLMKAKAVVIFPDMLKAGIGIGGSHGQGVLLARKATGWSDPAFYSSSSVSLGLELGAEESAVVMFVMTDKAYQALLTTSSFSLKAQAGYSLADLNTASQDQLSGADVVVWSKSRGAYGGLSLAGSEISQNSDYDRAYYGRSIAADEIVAGKATNRRAAPLLKALGGS